MLDKLLAPPVCLAEAFEDPPGLAPLGPEADDVARAVARRRQEYTTARWCARRALGGLGYGPVPVPRGERGAPVWPDGIVGSMTHCDGYRAAAVARAAEVLSVGIDAETHEPLPEGVLEAVSLPAERGRSAELAAAEPEVHWDRLLFSMKESVYKTWFPLTRRWLDFEQADITIGVDGTFEARLLVADPGMPVERLGGRWLVDRGLLVTAITLAP
ncbi:4'-phosphopantetheinyl transferase superfamily protein [Streptomyces sp. MUM 203J]|uniref:4'-phosphopantetheinyl transferase family protein n=1 Tax=Streptomyces sp. MUM 203J TaxID=2791990 RepID=UPI001F04FE20|nr:4'-phosphopantetheinyl transferase superfamily protein [Streptomyces sp. MUM 203J]MCH0538909.1 4'-phosphopantetheinyl transferase superfamily protein [Streptomyces sp. MUM 203J]